jgi:hypothetical protein
MPIRQPAATVIINSFLIIASSEYKAQCDPRDAVPPKEFLRAVRHPPKVRGADRAVA